MNFLLLSLQPLFPPERFDIFSPRLIVEWILRRLRCVLFFFCKYMMKSRIELTTPHSY